MEKTKWMPNESEMHFIVKDNHVLSKIIEPHLNFFKEVDSIVKSYLNLGKTCKTCPDYYFCNYENKDYVKELNLSQVYEKLISKFGIIKVKSALEECILIDEKFILDNMLLSGLFTYITIKYKDIDCNYITQNENICFYYNELLSLYAEIKPNYWCRIML